MCSENQERESSESPMLNAFWRVAPSVRLSFFAICDALVFLRAIVFSSRSSLEVHARRFFFLFAITPPFQERQLVSLIGAKEKQQMITNDNLVYPTHSRWFRTHEQSAGLQIKGNAQDQKVLLVDNAHIARKQTLLAQRRGSKSIN
jgi:hypothetical protein